VLLLFLCRSFTVAFTDLGFYFQGGYYFLGVVFLNFQGGLEFQGGKFEWDFFGTWRGNSIFLKIKKKIQLILKKR